MKVSESISLLNIQKLIFYFWLFWILVFIVICYLLVASPFKKATRFLDYVFVALIVNVLFSIPIFIASVATGLLNVFNNQTRRTALIYLLYTSLISLIVPVGLFIVYGIWMGAGAAN